MSKWRVLVTLAVAGGLAGVAARLKRPQPEPDGRWVDAVPSPSSQPPAGDS